MEFSIVVFLGSYAMEPALVADLAARGYRAIPSLVRYGDDMMESPSCCDWIVPGTETGA